jgi:hypothetical protein
MWKELKQVINLDVRGGGWAVKANRSPRCLLAIQPSRLCIYGEVFAVCDAFASIRRFPAYACQYVFVPAVSPLIFRLQAG